MHKPNWKFILTPLSFFYIFLFLSCTKQIRSVIVPIEDSTTNIDTAITPVSNVIMNEFIGIDGFHEDNAEDLKAVGFLRAYCNLDWFTGDNPNDEFIFQNSRSGWYFDDSFKKIKDAGLKINICIQHCPKNLRAGNQDDSHDEDKPINSWNLSTTAASSYSYFAEDLYQLAARYGRTNVNATKLRVKSDQIKSGLDLINYIEVWNEPDKDWKGISAQFSPAEYAALLSACYDKIKEADPTMKVVMAGLATLSTDYLKQMQDWCNINRADKKFPADVVNMHIYAFNNNIVWGKTWPLFGPAETPEDGKLKEKTEQLVKYCKENFPGTEVWISEFGWDTNSESALCPKKIDNLSVQEIQARWIIRGYLAFAAAGITKAQLFCLYDPSQNYIPDTFGTSGILERTNWAKKKIAWYYISTMRNILNNMVYIGEEASTNNILIYKFKDTTSNKGVYVIWSNTSNNISKNYNLNLNNNATIIKSLELTDGSISGNENNLVISNHSVEINVSEKPLFISVNYIK